MNASDVSVGDDVKNGRSGRWGTVVALQFDGTAVLAVRVRRHLGGGRYQHEPTWWSADSITMTERKP